ncbi:MAG: spore maturation protein [Clostridia bacterium]|nr:spore maturation protein [Clostridia bacterium]
MDKIGIYVVPVVIVLIVVFGVVKKVNIFDSFTTGAKEGINSLINIAPSLIGLVLAVTMLDSSGFFDIITQALSPLCEKIGIPSEVIPLGLMRPVSGSGSFALLNSILEKYGADSIIGKTASVMAGSTETTFYAITVYFGSVGIKKTRHTIPSALTADLCGIIFASLAVRMF